MRLQESIRIRKDQLNAASNKQIQAKDNLIKELTLRLKESTKVIAEIKHQYQRLKEDTDEISLLDQVRQLEHEIKVSKTSHIRQLQQCVQETQMQAQTKISKAMKKIEKERQKIHPK